MLDVKRLSKAETKGRIKDTSLHEIPRLFNSVARHHRSHHVSDFWQYQGDPFDQAQATTRFNYGPIQQDLDGETTGYFLNCYFNGVLQR